MFDWSDYLDLARALSGPHGPSVSVQLSEATSRSAVSRAYYAAFCHARNYAQRHLGYVSNNAPSDHGTLRQHYSLHGMKSVADSLDKLRGWRNQCDYRDVVNALQTIVRRSLREADSVINQL